MFPEWLVFSYGPKPPPPILKASRPPQAFQGSRPGLPRSRPSSGRAPEQRRRKRRRRSPPSRLTWRGCQQRPRGGKRAAGEAGAWVGRARLWAPEGVIMENRDSPPAFGSVPFRFLRAPQSPRGSFFWFRFCFRPAVALTKYLAAVLASPPAAPQGEERRSPPALRAPPRGAQRRSPLLRCQRPGDPPRLSCLSDRRLPRSVIL